MGYLDQIRVALTSTTNVKRAEQSRGAEKAEAPKATPGAVSISTTNADINLSETMSAISNKARINSPESQGLASASEIAAGKLVDGYHFDSIDCNKELLALKYNAANAPRIAEGTVARCENIDYTHMKTELENSPYAELFC